MEMNQFMALIRNLDTDCSGTINFRQLLSYFILLCSQVPSEQQVEVLSAIANDDGLIS